MSAPDSSPVRFSGPSVWPRTGERLWLTEPKARKRIRKFPGSIRGHLSDLEHTGLTVVRGAVDPERCDQIVVDLDLYLRAHGEVLAATADEHGRFRVNNLHISSEASLGVCLEPRLLEILDAAFGYPAVVYSSLTFVKGTEQYIHRDGPYFATDPPGFFFGVWTALEDIDAAAGPLLYYPGGHRLDVEHVVDLGVDTELVLDHSAAVLDACATARLSPRISVGLRKGDTVIWHPELPHGGAPVTDRALTRKSMVVHYKAGAIPLHGPHEFFGHRPHGDDLDRYTEHDGRWVVDHPFVTMN